MNNKLFESKYGYAIEETEEKKIKVYEYTVRDFDGIKDTSINETWINYEDGLYQSWSSTGYFAKYIDKYKERKVAINEAKKLLKIEE